MYKKYIKTISLIMVMVLTIVAFFATDVGAATKSQIQQEINRLEQESKQLDSQISSLQGKIDKQVELKNAIEKKMANVQSQIDACNRQINEINSKISANRAEIDKTNKQIEADKLAFKKRLRAIYMNNGDNNVEILLGAENFSDFLQLSQLTSSVSSRDQKLIESLIDDIKKLEKKQEENNALLDDQLEVKKKIDAKKAELAEQESAIQKVINSISKDQGEAKDEKAQVQKELKKMQKELASIINASGNQNVNIVYDGKDFAWPTPTVSNITSYYGWRWGRMHNGIDISNGQMGGRIVAIADGVVTTYSNSCPHNYGKRPVRNCCGSGYGNYITINHGTKNGRTYVAYYAHMSSIAVSMGQKVKKGQTVGYIGSTGRSTGPHLHFGIAVNGSWVNPMGFYSRVG